MKSTLGFKIELRNYEYLKSFEKVFKKVDLVWKSWTTLRNSKLLKDMKKELTKFDGKNY